MSSFFVSSLSSFLVVLMISFIVLVILELADLYSGRYPHNVEKQCCKYNLTELATSKITFCNSVLSLYIITITKNIQFLRLEYKLSKNSCEYSRC